MDTVNPWSRLSPPVPEPVHSSEFRATKLNHCLAVLLACTWADSALF